MSRFRNIAPLVVASAALIGLAGCSSSNQQAAATPPAPAPAPAPAPPPPPAPVVNPMAPSTLRQVQTALQQDGLYKGRVDGRWGPQTRRAVSAYQQQNGLQATGHLDQATLSALHIGGEGATSSSMNGMGGGSMGAAPAAPMAGSPPPAGGAPSSGTTSQ
jgi:peptidoglycan hydrolase-like protein with peptidoglycan-binding domain